jgi:hypothetical protein
MTWIAAPTIEHQWRIAQMTDAEREQLEGSRYFPGCNDARAAGVAPIYRGSPGYREGLDGDSDGVACEPYR